MLQSIVGHFSGVLALLKNMKWKVVLYYEIM